MKAVTCGAPRHGGRCTPSPAVLLGLMLAFILALSGCARVGSPSPSPILEPSGSGRDSPSAQASGSVSASPASTPNDATRPTFDELALVTVLATGLDVHADHARSTTVGADAVDGSDVRVVAGDHLLVMSTPAWAEGEWWLQIATDRGHGAIGWVLTGTPANPSLSQDASWCPADPSLSELVALNRIERRGCYGATHLTFDAYRATIQPDAGLGGACDPGGRPEWLVCDNINYNYVNRDGGYDWELQLHFDPATGIAPTGLHEGAGANPLLRITGHFADPAADQCAPRNLITVEAAGWNSRWLDCTTGFVVEKIQTP